MFFKYTVIFVYVIFTNSPFAHGCSDFSTHDTAFTLSVYYHEHTTSTSLLCAAVCGLDNACHVYSYDSMTGTCRLSDDQSLSSLTSSGATSSVVKKNTACAGSQTHSGGRVQVPLQPITLDIPQVSHLVPSVLTIFSFF